MADPVPPEVGTPPAEETITMAKAQEFVAAELAKFKTTMDQQIAESRKEVSRLQAALKASELDDETRESVYGAEAVKRDAATHLSAQFGVPVEVIADSWPYETMKARAATWEAAMKAGIEAELKKLAAQPPPASAERLLRSTPGTLPAASGDDAAYVKSVAEGGPWDPARSAAIMKRMGL